MQEFMTRNPVTMDADAPVIDAARKMRDSDIGDVIIVNNGALQGILTDRDIVVRCVVMEQDPSTTMVRDIVSSELVAVPPSTTVDQVVSLIRERAVKRVVIAEEGRPVGVVSMGDLATDLDPKSALADVARAAPNR